MPHCRRPGAYLEWPHAAQARRAKRDFSPPLGGHATLGAVDPQIGDGDSTGPSLESTTLLSHGSPTEIANKFGKPGEEHHTEQGTEPHPVPTTSFF
jgi:hypothetical protein